VLVVPPTLARRPRSQPNRKLNKLPAAAAADRVVLATRVPLVQPALQVSMAAMVSMDSQANPEIVEQPPPMEPHQPITVKNNAHAQPQPVMLVRTDLAVPTAHPAMLVLQVRMVNPAVLVQSVHPAQPVRPVMPERTAPLVMRANSALHVQAHPAQQVPTANPAVPAQLVNPAELAKTAVPAVQALPEMLAPQAQEDMLAVQAPQAIQAKMVPQAVANIAHLLVWLQVIKRRFQTRFSGDTEFRSKFDLYSKKTIIIIDRFFFPNAYPLVASLLLNFRFRFLYEMLRIINMRCDKKR
jgi:hypothetical protein